MTDSIKEVVDFFLFGGGVDLVQGLAAIIGSMFLTVLLDREKYRSMRLLFAVMAGCMLLLGTDDMMFFFKGVNLSEWAREQVRATLYVSLAVLAGYRAFSGRAIGICKKSPRPFWQEKVQ